jgi:hypothetical protein
MIPVSNACAILTTARADGRVRLSIENRRDDDDGRPARASLWCDTPLGLSSDLYDAPPNGPRITGETTRGDNDDGGGGGGIGRNGLFFQPRHRGDFVVGLLTSGTAAPPGGTFLALDNYCDDGGDAVGKARGRAEDGGVANAGLDGLLMPPPPARLSGAAAAATATSSYSRTVVPHPRDFPPRHHHFVLLLLSLREQHSGGRLSINFVLRRRVMTIMHASLSKKTIFY